MVHEVASVGGNRRFVVRLADGAEVESVLYRGDTLCVSSQVGCGVRCPFCASGANGVARSLTTEELFGQLEVVDARLRAEGAPPIARVTVSGSGEPLHNQAAVRSFVDAVRTRAPASLTTSGAPLARLEEWLAPPPAGPLHNGLTISVHAGTEPTRARLVPKGPSLASLFELLGRAVPRTSARRRKKLALAYLCLEGENDGDGEVDAFVDRALPLGLAVHLYAHNPVPTSGHRGVERARYEALYERMRDRGLVVRMSSRARLEPNGGCGTLVALRPSRAAAAGYHRPEEP